MSEASDKSQKTEQPTPKRLRDAARDGDILQSKELGTAVVMMGGAVWLALAGPWFISSCFEMIASGLQFEAGDLQNFDPAGNAWRLIEAIIVPIICLFAITVLAAIAGPAMLGSLGWRSKAMAFKGNKLNPLSGLKRMFGTHGLIELGKAIAKAILLGAIGWWLLTRDLEGFFAMGQSDIRPALANAGGDITFALLCLSVGLVLIAGIDVPIQIIRRTAKLRMTKQEVKDELRQTDGAPEMKQARRERQHEMLTGSARKAVTEATVILTNPMHFAVALRYRQGIDAAPVVVARGRGDVALAIRSLAKDQAVPTLEYPQLARAIYFTSRAGQIIAEDLYLSVAAILAFVMNIEQALVDSMQPPDVIVPEDKKFDEDGRKVGNNEAKPSDAE